MENSELTNLQCNQIYGDEVVFSIAPSCNEVAGPSRGFEIQCISGGGNSPDSLFVSAGMTKNSEGLNSLHASANVVDASFNVTKDYTFTWLIQNNIIATGPQAVIQVTEDDGVVSLVAIKNDGGGTLTHTLVLNGPYAQMYDASKVAQTLDFNVFLEGSVISWADYVNGNINVIDDVNMANKFVIQASVNTTGHKDNVLYEWWINGIKQLESGLESDLVIDFPCAVITVKATRITNNSASNIATETIVIAMNEALTPVQKTNTKGYHDNIWGVGTNTSPSQFDVILDAGIIKEDVDSYAIQASVNVKGLTSLSTSPYKNSDLDFSWWIQGTNVVGNEFVCAKFDNSKQAIVTVVVKHVLTNSIVSKTISLSTPGEYKTKPDSITDVPQFHNDLECGIIKLTNGRYLLQATSTTPLSAVNVSQIEKVWALNGEIVTNPHGSTLPLYSNAAIIEPEAILSLKSTLLSTSQSTAKTVVIKGEKVRLPEPSSEVSSDVSSDCSVTQPPKPQLKKLSKNSILVMGVTDNEWPDCVDYLALEIRLDNEITWKELYPRVDKNTNIIIELPNCSKYFYRYVAYKETII